MYTVLKFTLLLFFVTLSLNSSTAQGWIRDYGTNFYAGHEVVQASNNDFISCGRGNNTAYYQRVNTSGDTLWTTNLSYNQAGALAVDMLLLQDGSLVSVNQKGTAAVVVKLNAAGQLLFQNEWNWSSDISPTSIVEADSGFYVMGSISSAGSDTDLFLAKTDANGDTLWMKTYGGLNNEFASDMALTSDGGVVLTGETIIDSSGTNVRYMYVVKTDAQGNEMWQRSLNNGDYAWYGNAVTTTLDGGYLLAGNLVDITVADSRIMIAVKLDSTGNTSWISTPLSANLDCTALALVQAQDSSYILTGYYANYDSTQMALYQVPVLKIDPQGQLLWTRFYLEDQFTIARVMGNSIKQSADGGFILCGTNHQDFPVFSNSHTLIKMDANGNAVTTAIQGTIFADLDNSCARDSNEFELENWLVVATDTNGQNFFATTDSMGNYLIAAEYGNYSVSLALPNPYWDTLCLGTVNVQLNTPYQVDSIDFPVSAMIPCPLLDVDISAAFLRLCFPSYYIVHYCNSGIVAAQNAYVQVQLDTFISYNSSLIPATNLGNNLYQFNIGTVSPGDCGYFYINVTVDCDTNLAGISHCTEAHIYPDSVCNNAWSGPTLNLDVECLGDSVQFNILNTGGNMLSNLNYSIFEDNVMMRTGNYNLGNGQTEAVFVPTKNGSSYRMIAQQEPNFPPLLGDTLISLAIEACSLDSSGQFSTGFVTQFSNYSGSPFYDIDCQPNIGSYDPNDKLAYPVGYGSAHYIHNYTDLDYYIRFQNTGTDTAFKVVIVDTLSSFLDVASVQPAAASHPYSYEIVGNGTIIFTFDSILLPDSSTNLEGSQGFIKFAVEQVANNPVGTIINNKASIYFDYNAPVVTNTTFHEIGDNFYTIDIVGTEDVQMENVFINVFPNPFHQQARVQVSGAEFLQINFELYDITGKLLYQQLSYDNDFDIQVADLTAGVYFYRIIADGQLLNSGKLMAR
jgi:hypothetical protein